MDCEYTTNGITKTAGIPTGDNYAYFRIDGGTGAAILELKNFSYSGVGSAGYEAYAIYASDDHRTGGQQ